MASLKCKMCGGDLELIQDVTIAECPYCGTKQTVPNADNEKKLTIFARANRLRLNNEFDKAAGVYETIIGEFPEEAEAYWGLVLCKYGIEYVDDPATGKKIPTCHRSSFDSVMEDENLGLATEYADSVAKKLYREEAKQIEELRKGILEVSSTEEPYDIFICYKETDEAGERTLDSVLAQDIYTALTEKGYRVFFSRITLEDKLGQEYEPYIFAALHSAKVMLAVGTAYEYYDAVWVKNEWSRFLQLIAAGEKKVLIPCYKNLDAYDMPKEFAKLQAQDMGKVGALQDLVRGVEKILGKEKEKTESTGEPAAAYGVSMMNAQAASFVKRGYIALGDGEFETAESFFEQALNSDAECGQAYLGKALASREARNIEEFTESLIEELVDRNDEIKVFEMREGGKYFDVDSFRFDINLVAAVRAADEVTGLLSGFTDDELEGALTLEFGGTVIQFQYGYEPRLSEYEEYLKGCKSPKELGQMVRCRDFERADQYADDTVRRDIDAVWTSVVQCLKEGKAKEERFQAEWEEQKEKGKKEKQKEYEDTIAGWLKDASENLADWKTVAEAERKAEEEKAETAYQEALAVYEAAYIKRLNEWKQEKEEYLERYREATAKQAELRGKIFQLEQEKEQLKGFFNGKKRREAEENIAVLQNGLNAVILPREPGEAPTQNDAPKREDFWIELL